MRTLEAFLMGLTFTWKKWSLKNSLVRIIPVPTAVNQISHENDSAKFASN